MPRVGFGEDKVRLFVLLTLGLLIREFFSFWTGHPTDFELWVRLGYALNHGGDPYGILKPVPGLSFANVFGNMDAPTIAYLPFWPIVTGVIYLLYSLIGLDNRFLYYFLLKQPIILGDVGLAYLMFSYVYSKKPGKSAFWVLSFWLLSPFTIIISAIWGMFDSIAICLLFLAITSTGEARRSLWAGLGIFVKSVPIIYAAPCTMKRFKDLPFALLSIGLAGVLSLAAFVVMKWPLSVATGTLGSTALKGGWSMSAWDVFAYLNYVGLLPSFGSTAHLILGIIWIPTLIGFTCIAIKRFGTQREYGLIQVLLVCTLVFLIFKAQVTEQYALYLFALSAVDVALWNPGRKSLLFASMLAAMIYLIMNNYLLVRFLSPVYPGFVSFEDAMYKMIGPARYITDLLAGTAFTCLNIKYLSDVMKGTVEVCTHTDGPGRPSVWSDARLEATEPSPRTPATTRVSGMKQTRQSC